jgi:hypothetical protein
VSSSALVCFKCGLAVYPWREGYKHASGNRNGPTPAHRRHAPRPIPRADYERAFAIDTPVAEARAIVERYRGQS